MEQNVRKSATRSIVQKMNVGQGPDEGDRASSSAMHGERCASGLSEASTSSWAEDLEVEGTKLLHRLNEGLYSSDPKIPGELGEECQLWKQAFPHFRVEGKAITIPRAGSQQRSDSPTAEEEEVFAIHGNNSHSQTSQM